MIAGISDMGKQKSPFLFTETGEGIELSEDGKPVFFYQKINKTVPAMGVFNNYLHPVYDLKGEIITEEFPRDHLNHRGIFWAWHQLFIDNKSLGDGWIMENLSQDIVRTENITNGKSAILDLVVLWKSKSLENGGPYIEEKTTIIVHKREKNIRKIDFEITLKPLVPGIQIGGSADEKGYGGFCTRIIMPDNLTFTSENGPLTPQNLQIISGPWMDFSWTSESTGNKSGLAILCHPSTPNYPAPWILRQKASMQNIVFPGRDRIKLDKPVTLRYRVIIHDGEAKDHDIPELQAEYNRLIFSGK